MMMRGAAQENPIRQPNFTSPNLRIMTEGKLRRVTLVTRIGFGLEVVLVQSTASWVHVLVLCGGCEVKGTAFRPAMTTMKFSEENQGR